MRAPSWPQSASPFCQSSAVARACSSALRPARAASVSSIQGRKSPGASAGKVSSRFPRSPFGSIAIAGHAVDGGLFEQAHAQAGLAAAGHAEADRVGGEVLGVHQQRLGADAAVGLEQASQVEAPQPLEVGRLRHPFPGSSNIG